MYSDVGTSTLQSLIVTKAQAFAMWSGAVDSAMGTNNFL